MGRTGGADSTVAGKPVTVVASRGGSYAPRGTPRESFEFVQNYLEKVFTGMLGMEVDFIVPELTLAPTQPTMAELIPLAEASRAKAFEDAEEKARALADRLTAAKEKPPPDTRPPPRPHTHSSQPPQRAGGAGGPSHTAHSHAATQRPGRERHLTLTPTTPAPGPAPARPHSKTAAIVFTMTTVSSFLRRIVADLLSARGGS